MKRTSNKPAKDAWNRKKGARWKQYQRHIKQVEEEAQAKILQDARNRQ